VGLPPATAKEKPNAQYRMVDATFLHAMGVPIVRGREFTDADNQKSTAVSIVSEALAKIYWKGRDPVGTHILLEDASGAPRDVEVVGVSGSMRESALDDPATPSVFVPVWQVQPGLARFLAGNFFWTVRTKALTGVHLRHEVAAVDGDVAVAESTMDQYMERALGRQRFSLRMLVAFALAGMLLAGTGLYSLIAYSTRQRTREIGIRIAMGARLYDVTGLVVRQALGLAVAGVMAGILAAWAGRRVIAPLLFEVSANDAWTLSLAGVAILALATVAAYLPARRAGRVDPAVKPRGLRYLDDHTKEACLRFCRAGAGLAALAHEFLFGLDGRLSLLDLAPFAGRHSQLKMALRAPRRGHQLTRSQFEPLDVLG